MIVYTILAKTHVRHARDPKDMYTFEILRVKLWSAFYFHPLY